MNALRAWAMVVLLVSLAPGCGARVAPEPQGVLAGEPSGSAAESPQPSESAPAASADSSVSVAGSTSPATVGGASPAPRPPFGPKHNNGVVKISLSTTCVRPGDLLVVTLRTPANAGVAMVIGFSDNQAHGAMNTGQSDAQGDYVWRVPVAPTAPDGLARVLVTSTGSNWEQEGGGTGDAEFTVTRGTCA